RQPSRQALPARAAVRGPVDAGPGSAVAAEARHAEVVPHHRVDAARVERVDLHVRGARRFVVALKDAAPALAGVLAPVDAARAARAEERARGGHEEARLVGGV